MSGCVHLAAPGATRPPAASTLPPATLRHVTLARPGPAAALRVPDEALRRLRARPNLPPPLSGNARLRLVVSVSERAMWLVEGRDTLFRMPVALANGLSLSYDGRFWRFQTPRGDRRVLRKVAQPVWTPPDWHYAEAALAHRLRLAPLSAAGVSLSGGRRLAVRNGVVGIVRPGDRWRALPVDEHLVFDGKLFIPPIGTRNRRIAGELGPFALDLGSGYMIHGSPVATSLDQATTHGCIRVTDEVLRWLYENVPVGTTVRII
jgi:hypothetical protein